MAQVLGSDVILFYIGVAAAAQPLFPASKAVAPHPLRRVAASPSLPCYETNTGSECKLAEVYLTLTNSCGLAAPNVLMLF